MGGLVKKGNHSRPTYLIKVDGLWVARFLHGTLYSIGMWFGEDQRTNIIKNMFKIEWTMFSNINSYSTLQLGGPIYPIKKTTKMHFREPETESGEVWFSIHFFANVFIIDLLMQHEHYSANINGRSWRTWKMNQITPTYLSSTLISPLHPQSLTQWHRHRRISST